MRTSTAESEDFGVRGVRSGVVESGEGGDHVERLGVVEVTGEEAEIYGDRGGEV